MYWGGWVTISNVWNEGIQEVIDLDPVMILMVFFCSWNTSLFSDEFLQNMIMFIHYGMDLIT